MTTVEKNLQNKKLKTSLQELRKRLITLINEYYSEKDENDIFFIRNEYYINYNERLFHLFENVRNSIIWEVDRRIKELEDYDLND